MMVVVVVVMVVARGPVLTGGRSSLAGVQGSVRRYTHVRGRRLRQVFPVRAEERQPARVRPRQSHLARL